MKSICCLFLFILISTSARADLGETLDQCKARYGEPVDRKMAPNLDEMILFKKSNLKYSVGLKNGVCVLLILGKDSDEKLSDTEVSELLIVNSGGSSWKKSIRPTGNQIWTREDRSAVAQFDSLFGILTLLDAQYMKAEMAKKKAGGS